MLTFWLILRISCYQIWHFHGYRITVSSWMLDTWRCRCVSVNLFYLITMHSSNTTKLATIIYDFLFLFGNGNVNNNKTEPKPNWKPPIACFWKIYGESLELINKSRSLLSQNLLRSLRRGWNSRWRSCICHRVFNHRGECDMRFRPIFIQIGT